MSKLNPAGILAGTIPAKYSHSPAELAPLGITQAQAMALAVRAGELEKAQYGDSIPETAADITAEIVEKAASFPRWRKISKATVLASVALTAIAHLNHKRHHFEQAPDDGCFDGMAPVTDCRPGGDAAQRVLLEILAA